jgi:hypothetical protein
MTMRVPVRRLVSGHYANGTAAVEAQTLRTDPPAP